MCSCGVDNVMQPLEDTISLGVFASAFSPSFDDTCVVAMAFKVAEWPIQDDKGTGKEFESDCLCPFNVTPFRFPVTDEPPCMPMLSHNDAKAHF